MGSRKGISSTVQKAVPFRRCRRYRYILGWVRWGRRIGGRKVVGCDICERGVWRTVFLNDLEWFSRISAAFLGHNDSNLYFYNGAYKKRKFIVSKRLSVSYLNVNGTSNTNSKCWTYPVRWNLYPSIPQQLNDLNPAVSVVNVKYATCVELYQNLSCSFNLHVLSRKWKILRLSVWFLFSLAVNL